MEDIGKVSHKGGSKAAGRAEVGLTNLLTKLYYNTI